MRFRFLLVKPILLFCIAITALLLTPFIVGASEKRLRGHVPEVTSHLRSLGRLSTTNRLHLAIGLPLRNGMELTSFLQQIYDPKSTNYHRFLTNDEFTEKFGPSEKDYEAVINFAKTNGLNVVAKHRNRLLLNVTASVADIERSFHVRMHTFNHPSEARQFYAPDAEPSLDPQLPISEIRGLHNYSLPHTAGGDPVPPDGSGPALMSGTGSGVVGSFMGNDFRAAYAPGVTLTGAGQTVGIVAFDGYYPGDILAYELTNGLPAVPLTNVLVDGFSGIPGDGGFGSAGSLEFSGDIEMVISMAPGLSQVIVYEAPYFTAATGWVDLLNQIVTDNRAKVITCSVLFNSVNTGVNSAITDAIFQQMAAQGQTFCEASGDFGAFSTAVDEPIGNPYITDVGGTTLQTTGPGGDWLSEVVWNDYTGGFFSSTKALSGGGFCSAYEIPLYQQGLDMSANLGSTTFRNIPDVAMTADNFTIYYGNGKQTASGGGTSFSAPLFAGFVALVNQQAAAVGLPPVGFINPSLYAIGQGSNYLSAFHDIVSGNNSYSHTNKYFAVPGYDLCTGWGTPNGQGFIDALLGGDSLLIITPAKGFVASGAAGGPFNLTTQTYSLTNTGSTALTWLLGSTSAWLSASSTGGSLGPGGQTNTTITLNSEANALSAGVYDASVWFTNGATGHAQGRAFTLFVDQPIVRNGGFETGDFSYWTGLSTVEAYSEGASIQGNGFGHSGSFGAFIVGPLASHFQYDFLGQTVPTFPGQPYLLSFWFSQNDYYPEEGVGENEFITSWNGDVLMHKFNMAPMAYGSWTNVQIIVQANDTSSFLQFGFHEGDNAFASFDDVSLTPLFSLAPTFEVQPTRQTAPAGTNVTIRAVVAGTAPIHYEWQFNGTNLLDTARIDGAATNALVINDVHTSDLGNYQLVVTNLFGASTSSIAALTLPPDCFPAWDGLVAWWRGESNAVDSAGMDNGSVYTATFTPGKVGRAFKLSGSNTGAFAPALNLSAGNALTIEAWIKPTAFERTPRSAIIHQSSDWLLTFANYGDSLVFGLNAGGAYSELSVPIKPGDYADGNWHHLAATYDGLAKRIYRDGVEISSTVQNGNLSFSGGSLTIGGNQIFDPNSEEYFYGLIDELTVFNRALSSSEIQSIYLADTAGKCVDRPPPTLQAAAQNNGTIAFTWSAVTGKNYQVQYKTNLSQPDWINLGNPIGATNSTAITSDGIGPDPQRFYRLGMLP